LLVTLGIHQFAKGFFSMASILTGLVVGYRLAIPMGMVNFDAIANAAWFAVPTPLKFGMKFNFAAILGMSIMALITTIESVGDISEITIGGAGREAMDKELSGRIMADGIGTSPASLFGDLPNTSYSQHVGVAAIMGAMSRHVVTIGTILLVLSGLVPKLGAIVSAMAQAVLGAASIVMFVMIAAGSEICSIFSDPAGGYHAIRHCAGRCVCPVYGPHFTARKIKRHLFRRNIETAITRMGCDMLNGSDQSSARPPAKKRPV
jgi:NCS2 family nucleobase:cation symporter-2